MIESPPRKKTFILHKYYFFDKISYVSALNPVMNINRRLKQYTIRLDYTVKILDQNSANNKSDYRLIDL